MRAAELLRAEILGAVPGDQDQPGIARARHGNSAELETLEAEKRRAQEWLGGVLAWYG
jgi:hypothetical protein